MQYQQQRQRRGIQNCQHGQRTYNLGLEMGQHVEVIARLSSSAKCAFPGPRQLRVAVFVASLCMNYAQYTPPTRTRRNCFVASASAVWTQFATSSRRLLTDSVDSLETDQTDSVAFDYTNFEILITFSTMTSLCRHCWKSYQYLSKCT